MSFAGQPDADNLRQAHPDRPAEHHRLGLDTANAPAHHAQRIDHGGVAVGADQRIDEGHAVLDLHDRRELFEIDLVQDTVARHHHADLIEGALRPGQKFETLGVLALLDGHILVERIAHHAAAIDVERMVHHQLRWHRRIDAGRIAAGIRHRIAQPREVYQRGGSQQILQNDPRREIRKIRLGPAMDDLLQGAIPTIRRARTEDVLGKHPAGIRKAAEQAGGEVFKILTHGDVVDVVAGQVLHCGFHR